ncbi:MAG: hypothetical protein M1834_004675 [Cirrosporium novae-zelandiae]|nr:MAG: hypothetical protein M1834_004675 [Cirrosporium novae-zelandiae]
MGHPATKPSKSRLPRLVRKSATEFCIVEEPPEPAPEELSEEEIQRRRHPRFKYFFDLPSEIRNNIYKMALCVNRTIDMDPTNYRRIAPRLDLFLTCKRIHAEAYPIFYGSSTFRLFPIHGRFMGNRQLPLLARLPPHYRKVIRTLELRLGPGWSSPPKSWHVHKRLGLPDLESLKTLKVFVECDPSHSIFKGFRISKDFFTGFAGSLLEGLLAEIGSVENVQFDGYPSVERTASLMTRLLEVTKLAGRKVTWGPERGWNDDVVCDEGTIESLNARMAGLVVGGVVLPGIE